MISENYTREQRLTDLNKVIDILPLNDKDREVLIKQIAMVRINDMDIANECDNNKILKLQLDIMEGAAVGKIS
jgi:hypothetical protein